MVIKHGSSGSSPPTVTFDPESLFGRLAARTHELTAASNARLMLQRNTHDAAGQEAVAEGSPHDPNVPRGRMFVTSPSASSEATAC